VRSLYAVWSLSSRPSAFIRRFLNEEGENGSFAEDEPVGNNAAEMSRVRNSSVVRRSAGNWIVFCTGVFGLEKKLNLDVPELAVGLLGAVFAKELESSVGSVGRCFASFAGRSGLVDREEDIVGLGLRVSCSETGTPSWMGAEVPENHDARPPRDLSSTLIFPSLSPVRVGMKFSSISSLFFSFVKLCTFLSGERELVLDVRKEGSSAVNDR
jgi:hypothetical protein